MQATIAILLLIVIEYCGIPADFDARFKIRQDLAQNFLEQFDVHQPQTYYVLREAELESAGFEITLFYAPDLSSKVALINERMSKGAFRWLREHADVIETPWGAKVTSIPIADAPADFLPEEALAILLGQDLSASMPTTKAFVSPLAEFGCI
jgi:hypothetical protein